MSNLIVSTQVQAHLQGKLKPTHKANLAKELAPCQHTGRAKADSQKNLPTHKATLQSSLLSDTAKQVAQHIRCSTLTEGYAGNIGFVKVGHDVDTSAMCKYQQQFQLDK